MATPTYTAIASITLGSSASSVTFSSIPQDYRDLVLVIDGTASVATSLYIRANGDSGANYSFVRMRGTGSSAASNSSTGDVGFLQAALDTVQSNSIMQIMDYSATDKHKTALVRHNLPSIQTTAAAERWANTSAITSLTILTVSGNYNSGCNLALYGIAS